MLYSLEARRIHQIFPNSDPLTNTVHNNQLMDPWTCIISANMSCLLFFLFFPSHFSKVYDHDENFLLRSFSLLKKSLFLLQQRNSEVTGSLFQSKFLQGDEDD